MPKKTTLLDEEPMIAPAQDSDIVDAEIVNEPAEPQPSNQLAVQSTNPMALIDKAIALDIDTEKLRQLLDLQERWEANQARKSYNEAMSLAQAEMIPVVRDKYNKQTESRYAQLETIDASIKPVYTKHGFSLTFGTLEGAPPKHYRMYCDCRHRDGHTERITADLPTDDAGIKGTVNKTPIQAMGSTFSYGRRYMTLLVFNVAMAGEDNDGNGAPDTIGPGQQQAIKNEIERFPPDMRDRELASVLLYGECESLEQFPISKFQALMTGLKKGADKFHS